MDATAQLTSGEEGLVTAVALRICSSEVGIGLAHFRPWLVVGNRSVRATLTNIAFEQGGRKHQGCWVGEQMHHGSGHQTSCADVSCCSVHLFSTSIPHLSVPEHFDLLCRTDREVALRAAARYIDLLLHHLVNVHVCIFPCPKLTATEGSSMFSGLLA